MSSPDKAEETWRRITTLSKFGPSYVIEDSFGERFGGHHTKDLLAPVIETHGQELQQVAFFDRPVTRVWMYKGEER